MDRRILFVLIVYGLRLNNHQNLVLNCLWLPGFENSFELVKANGPHVKPQALF